MVDLATSGFCNERKSKSKTCCECAGRELREPRFKQEQEDTATSSTEYQKRIYRVSADNLRFHRAVEGTCDISFAHPQSSLFIIPQAKSSRDQRKPVQPAAVICT